MSCRRHRAKSCPARLRLVGWATPEGAAHVVCRGYPGSYPHTFALIGKAKQWYTFAVESMYGDWDELKDKFYLAFFPMSHIDSLPRVILDFEQYEKESISVA